MKMLKKKMKGVGFSPAAGVSSMEKPPPYPVVDDSRTRLRHQSLLQDYDELLKETESTKLKLQMMKKRKLTLLDEVRFLRKRHQFLLANQSTKQVPPQKSLQQQGSQPQRKKASNKKNNSRKEAALEQMGLGLGLDLNQKGKFYDGKEASFRTPPPIFDLNQKVKTSRVKEPTLRQGLDLNQKERLYGANEATPSNVTPIFDLNQISMEEEELQYNADPFSIEEPKRSSLIKSGNSDDQVNNNDMKLSACRSVGTGPNRSGKRKITWQDQVALRV